MTPMRAFELFRMLSEEDMTLLWMNGEHCRPESLITWTVPVPPVPIRPSVAMDIGGGSNEDDLTVKLQEIIDVNNALRVALDNGATMKMIAEDWEFLQIQAAQFVNGEVPGVPRALAGSKPIRGLCQRLKGKQGRFRGNLSGKRVDFSARTVISPDPNLRIEQVGVPIHVAKVMTFPERVNRYNIELLRECVRNGPDVHPGANFLRDAAGVVRSLAYGDRNRTAESLKIGDVVERHMHDDDVVLFNRQPSLHKMSIMAHRVKVSGIQWGFAIRCSNIHLCVQVFPWRTFRFNECACAPYNADFDGDEMNMHLPQTEEAKAEAADLMAIQNNLITPRNGEPMVAATQDFLTGAHLLTRKDVFLFKEEFMQLVAAFSDADEHIDLPEPAIYKPHKMWTGKQVFSLLVRPNHDSDCFVNVESMERFYSKDKFFCPEDGYVCFQNGELLCGNLGKKTLGGDSKMGLFYVLIRDYGPLEATRRMSRLAKLCARYLGDRGFSIGVDDVTPSTALNAMKDGILTSGQRDANEQISLYKEGKIKLKPGCDELQSLESEVNGILGRIRERAGKESIRVLHHTNAPHTMAQCGSKGSTLNISQMVACLGQQSVGGSRIQDGFVNRTLPHFPLGALEPAAKGFVANSFFSGLTATEFFFHTMGGREGLVDTAVKTAETGYMARRLMKALEDLSMQYDNTVRNSEQTVVQFCYGDDGLNPQLMEGGDRPVDYKRMMMNIRLQQNCPEELPSSGNDIRALVAKRLSEPEFQTLLPQGRLFLDETKEFFDGIASILDNMEGGAVKSRSAKEPSFGTLRDRLAKMSATEKAAWRKKATSPKTKEYAEAIYLLKDNVLRVTPSQVEAILVAALKKYNRSMIEPGEAVGAVGAQSISEPGTQMTLKTFHFAGVASMNVTLGVPRLKEIINASKTISTPIITANLIQNDNKTSARLVKGRIEKTTLGEVCEYIREVHTPEMSYVSIRLDMEIIRKLHLNIDAHTVRWSILHLVGSQRSPVLRGLKDKNVIVMPASSSSDGSYCRLRVLSPELKDNGKGMPSQQRTFFNLQALKSSLPGVIVEGIPTVSRAVINEEEVPMEGNPDKTRTRYYLLVEGYGMQDVMCSPGVDGRDTKSNHVIEVQQVLGIEAARSAIASEIGYIMSAYGITVDRRHLMLLSDVMTFKGEILGITRFGVAKMRESVLMLASFEKTSDHLFDAAVHSREDSIVGVSECIIMGVPVPIGTGLFKVIQKQKDAVKIETRKRILE